MAGSQGGSGGLTRDERYCSHCSLDTPHLVRDDTHERDSSNDYRQCLRCGWEYFGCTGRYAAPTLPFIPETSLLQKPDGVLVSLLAAVDEGGLIGVDGGLPWRCPVDTARFKRLTYTDLQDPPKGADARVGKAVILGRTTYDCIARKYGKVLPGRKLVVLSRVAAPTDIDPPIWGLARTPQSALDAAAVWARRTVSPEIVVIGGAQAYKEYLPVADRVYMTTVDGVYSTGSPRDVYFPDWRLRQWEAVYRERFPKDPATPNTPGHLFEVYARRAGKG